MPRPFDDSGASEDIVRGKKTRPLKSAVTLKSKVAKGLKWQAINILGRQGISLVVFTTLARLLDPAAFGLVGLVGVYLGFIAIFADQGIGPALIQRQELEPEHMDAAFWTNLSCSLFLCGGTILLAGPISSLLGDARLAPLLRWSSLGLVIRGLSAIHSTLLIKEMDFRSSTIRTFLANAVGGVVGVAVALGGYGVWALVAQQLSSATTGAIFLWRISSYRPTMRFSAPHFRQLTAVGWSTFATSLLWFFSSRLDQMVIGRFAGAFTLGFYVIGNKLPDMAKNVTQGPLGGISLPTLSKLQNDHPKMCETIYKGMELNATITFAAFVGLAAISSELVPFLFGQKWAEAASLSSLLSLYALVHVLMIFVHPALLASGGAGRFVILNALQAVGMVIACVVGIQFGVHYLILSMIGVSLLLAAPALLFLRNRIGLSPIRYCQPCVTPAAAAGTMAFAIWVSAGILPLDISAGILIAWKIVVGAATYIGMMILLKRRSLVSIAEMARQAIK